MLIYDTRFNIEELDEILFDYCELHEINIDTLTDTEKNNILDAEIYFLDDVFRCELKKLNLDNILLVGNMRIWEGWKSCYKLLNNLADIMNLGYDFKLYSNRYDLLLEVYHHDGSGLFKVRQIKDINNIDRFLNRILNNNYTSKQLAYYTRSIKKEVEKIEY